MNQPAPGSLARQSTRWWAEAYGEGWFPMAESTPCDTTGGSGHAEGHESLGSNRAAQADAGDTATPSPRSAGAAQPAPEAAPLQLFRSVERALMPLDGRFHCPRSLQRERRRGRFRFSLNRAFPAVLELCADRPETWISPELAGLYLRWQAEGLAHSVEAWRDGELAAGLLAIGIGGCWIGESMAHRLPQAGNVLLVELVEALRRGGFSLFDVQLSNPHLERFGCHNVSDAVYRSALRRARRRQAVLQLGDDRALSRSWWCAPDARIIPDKKRT